MSEKRKIALFVSAIGYGGAERVVSLLLDELNQYFDVTLILLYNEIHYPISKPAKLVTLADEKETFKTNFFSRTIDTIKFIIKYRQILKVEKIEVAISFMLRQNIINSIAKINNAQLKTIISERCFPSLMYKESKTTSILTKVLIPFFYNLNDKLFSNSIYINNDLITNYGIKIDTSVIYNPILTIKEKPLLTAYNNLIDNFKVVTVGRLIAVKNHENLVASIKMLPNNFFLDIYGGGELETELQDQINKLGLSERIKLKGNVTKVKEKIVVGHCFVLTSLTEGFPNVILEAMSVGLPIISANCMSGPLELLNDNEEVNIPSGTFVKAKYGLLINVDDAIGTSHAIKYMQNNIEERKRYSQLSYSRAKTYDVSKITIEVKNLIDSL